MRLISELHNFLSPLQPELSSRGNPLQFCIKEAALSSSASLFPLATNTAAKHKTKLTRIVIKNGSQQDSEREDTYDWISIKAHHYQVDHLIFSYKGLSSALPSVW